MSSLWNWSARDATGRLFYFFTKTKEPMDAVQFHCFLVAQYPLLSNVAFGPAVEGPSQVRREK